MESEMFISEDFIKADLDIDSDESEEENEGYTRQNKFYNESTVEESSKDVENTTFKDVENLNEYAEDNRFQNINIVTDDFYKKYVSNLKSENTNVTVNVVECKSLSSFKSDVFKEGDRNTLWMIVTGLYTVGTVNNLSELNGPYIPVIKKLSWNMKRLTEYEEGSRQLQNDLKDLLPASSAVVVLPPLPVVVLVNAMNTTKSNKFNEFYCNYIKNISQVTLEMLEEQDLPCNDAIKNYLEIKDYVFEINASTSKDLCVLTVNKWKTLGEWYKILTDIAGLKTELDLPFLDYKPVVNSGNEAVSYVHSAASFIRQANLVTSDNIPEIEFNCFDESMVPQLTKWPNALNLKSFSNTRSDSELKIFQNEAYKLQADKFKVESNVSRTVVVVGEKMSVSKFCNIEIPTVKFHQLYVEDNNYEATRVPSDLLRAENTIWIFFCDIASSLRKKKQSFCERHFSEKKCRVELNMNSLNCSTEKDRCTKLKEFVLKIHPSLPKSSFIIPVPIIPQTSLLPPSDTFKMEDFHNVVHESDDLRNLWIFLPSMQKLQIADAIKKFDKEWWKVIEKIMIQQNLKVEFLLDYKENAHKTVDILENPRLFKVNQAYEEWEQFIKAFIMLYLHAMDNTDSSTIYFKKGASRGVLMLHEESSSSSTIRNTNSMGNQFSVLRAAHIVKPPVLHPFVHQKSQGPPLDYGQVHNSYQGMQDSTAINKRKLYLYDIPKTLTNSALKDILNICGYVTSFQRDFVGGIRAATCLVEFRDSVCIYRAYHLLNGLKILNSNLCVVIPEEKHFTAQEKVFDQKYETEDSMEIKRILADRSSWGSKSPEHQKLEKTRSDTESRYLQNLRLKSFELAKQTTPINLNRQADRSRSQERYLSRDHIRRNDRSRSRERSFSRDVKRRSDSSSSSEGSHSRDLKRRYNRSRSRDRRSRSRDRRNRSRDRRSRSRETNNSHKQHESSGQRSSHKRNRSRDQRSPQSRSRSRSQEYKMSHERRLSPKQSSSSGFTEGRECLALITLSEKLGILGISFKLLMESCVNTESLDILYEEDNMILMNTIKNKYITLQNSTSDIIDSEKYKCGAKLCKKLMETIISKKASNEIALPPTIPLHLPGQTLQNSMNIFNSSTLYETTFPKVSSDRFQQSSFSSNFQSTSGSNFPLNFPSTSVSNFPSTSVSNFPSTSGSNFPSTYRSEKKPNAVEEKMFLHGVNVERIAKCTQGKDAVAIKDFINNSLEYVGVAPSYNLVFEIYSAVSMLHFNWADN